MQKNEIFPTKQKIKKLIISNHSVLLDKYLVNKEEFSEHIVLECALEIYKIIKSL